MSIPSQTDVTAVASFARALLNSVIRDVTERSDTRRLVARVVPGQPFDRVRRVVFRAGQTTSSTTSAKARYTTRARRSHARTVSTGERRQRCSAGVWSYARHP